MGQRVVSRPHEPVSRAGDPRGGRDLALSGPERVPVKNEWHLLHLIFFAGTHHGQPGRRRRGGRRARWRCGGARTRRRGKRAWPRRTSWRPCYSFLEGKEGGSTVGEKKGLGSLKRRFSFAFGRGGGARGLGSGWIRARVRRAPRW